MSGVCYYRLRVLNQLATEELCRFTSRPLDPKYGFVSKEPQGDGTTIDPQYGGTTIGQFRIQVSDAQLGGVVYAVTQFLADATARMQMLTMPAIIEYSYDDVDWSAFFAGYINEVDLIEGFQEYEFTVGDAPQLQNIEVFKYVSPNINGVSCILGSTPADGFGPISAANPPRFQVVAIDLTTGLVTLQFYSGAVTPLQGTSTFGTASGQTGTNQPVATVVNQAASQYFVGYVGPWAKEAVPTGIVLPPASNGYSHAGWFPGLTAQVYDLNNNILCDLTPVACPAVTVQEGQQITEGTTPWGSPGPQGGYAPGGSWQDTYYDYLYSAGYIYLTQPPNGAISGLTVGQIVQVIIYPSTIDSNHPLHFIGSPVDLAAALFADQNIIVTPQSIASTKAAIGQVGVMYRITSSMTFQDAVNNLCFGPFGFARRTNAQGQMEFMPTRVKALGLPSFTLGIDDIRDTGSRPFQNALNTAINRVTLDTQLFHIWGKNTDGGTKPADGIVGQDNTVSITNGDTTINVNQELSWTIPGAIITMASIPSNQNFNSTAPYVDLNAFTIALASEFFDRWGRGSIEGDLYCTRRLLDSGTQIGDVIIVDLPFMPGAAFQNTPTMQRGTPRIMQITQWTPQPMGVDIHVIDAGTLDQAAIVPTFTAAPAAIEARRVIDITLTNAPLLADQGSDVLFQLYLGGSGPPPTADQAGFQLNVMQLTINPAITTYTSTPLDFWDASLQATSNVWIRAQALWNGNRPSAWSSWVEVGLSGASPPTMGVSPVIDTMPVFGTIGATVSWTNGEPDLLTAIFLRPTSASAAQDQKIATVPAGTTSYTIEGLIPNTAYTISVAHVDRAPFQFVSAKAVAPSFTTNATTGQSLPLLSPVSWAAGYAVAQSAQSGTFGIDATTQEWPAVVDLYVAVETAIGSGTPGTFGLQGSIQATQNSNIAGVTGRTRISATAINDGLHRYFYATVTRTGKSTSAATPTFSYLPFSGISPAPVGGSVDPFTGFINYLEMGATADDGSGGKLVTKGTQFLQAVQGATVVFPTGYNAIPNMDVIPGNTKGAHEPRGLWGTIAQVTAQSGNSTAFNAGLFETDISGTSAATALGATVQALLAQPGTSYTGQSLSFPTTKVAPNGTSAGLSLGSANLPSYNAQYNVSIYMTFDMATVIASKTATASCPIYVDLSTNSGSSWTQVGSGTASASATTPGTYTAGVGVTFSATVVPGSTLVRFRVGRTSTLFCTLSPYPNTYAQGQVVTWITSSTTPIYASQTPNTTDFVTLRATAST